MKSAGSWPEAVNLSSDDSDSDSKHGVGITEPSSTTSVKDVKQESIFFPDDGVGSTETSNKSMAVHSGKDVTSKDAVITIAEMYQEYMKQIPIPTHRGSEIPFTTWQGLAKSLKSLYGEPLHYLTNVLLKQWDQLRIGTDDECQPLDTIIHPCKAEATIWLMEEVHRLTSSHHHLAELWASDPMYHAFIDPVRKKKIGI